MPLLKLAYGDDSGLCLTASHTAPFISTTIFHGGFMKVVRRSYFCFLHPSFLLAFTWAAQLLPISVWNLPEIQVKWMFNRQETAGYVLLSPWQSWVTWQQSNYEQWRERTHLALCHVLQIFKIHEAEKEYISTSSAQGEENENIGKECEVQSLVMWKTW